MCIAPDNVISVRNIKKKIGDKWIIKGVSFDIKEGEIFGFLGPNGSGKTTTIRMLVDLIRPTEGEIIIGGKALSKQREEALADVGSIVENPEMYPYMTGWENLEHFARMLPGVGQDRIREVVEIVGLENRIHDKVKTYSLGMRQRLGIAQALLGKPKLLILDEPTNGLDPQGIKELREFIRKLADEGLSLFISSHLLSEIQLMCDRVAIIHQGSVISVGGVNELLNQSKETVVVSLDRADLAEAVLEQAAIPYQLTDSEQLVEIDAMPGVQVIEAAMDPGQAADVIRRLVEAGVQVYTVERRKPTLEQLFLTLTGGERIG